jgi:lysylphosphatidylglycerol synthetase-like protein (DUF2156 family)
MTSVAADSRGAVRALDDATNDRLVRTVLFLAIFFQLWLTASPFPDLSDPKALEPAAEGNLLSQILTVILTGTLVGFAYAKQLRLASKAITPILVLTFLWFACSAVLSLHAGLAARRLVLATFVVFQSPSRSSPAIGVASSPTRTAPAPAWPFSSSSASTSFARSAGRSGR